MAEFLTAETPSMKCTAHNLEVMVFESQSSHVLLKVILVPELPTTPELQEFTPKVVSWPLDSWNHKNTPEIAKFDPVIFKVVVF